ncbi:MAG: hypothetical protein JW839_22150 [Candidatus Lokiarchaeota archaeon]|nr:hypothetical protein [Candidatus Lokiarchaeota archaeon]
MGSNPQGGTPPGAIDTPARHPPLTMRAKVAYVTIFFAGIFFTSPPFIPISIVCAAILLLQNRNKKVAILGVLLVGLDVVVIAVFLELMISAGRAFP